MNEPHGHPRRLLADFAEEALEPARAERVGGHLRACARCRAELDEWRELYDALARIPRPAPPFGLRDRIVFAVARESRVQGRRARGLRRRVAAALSWAYGSGLALAASAAATLVLVPELRSSAAITVAWASGVGIRAGLAVVEISTGLLVGAQEMLGSLIQHTDWLIVLFRALGTAGESPEARIALVVAAGLSALLYPVLVAGRLPRSKGPGEASHVGALLA